MVVHDLTIDGTFSYPPRMKLSTALVTTSIRWKGIAQQRRGGISPFVEDDLGVVLGVAFSSPGWMRRAETTFQPVSIPSRRNRTSFSRSRSAGRPARQGDRLPLAITSACS